MYKVIEVAKLFSVSKVTVYKKITANKEALKGHITKKKNITYLDDEAVEIIKNTLQANQEKASGRLIDEELNRVYEDIKCYEDANNKLRSEKISMLNDELAELESTIRLLNSQINVKKSQLRANEKIIENFDSILKNNKSRIKLLESVIEEFESV